MTIHTALLALALIACDGPGTEETDQACTDADADGFCVEDDCDDGDDTTYPGAEEIPYDGADNGCEGDGDVTDVDGDGYLPPAMGGEDCDDFNPVVFPGAEEECYADVDYNCDGFWGGDDCDRDGYDKYEDCNDEDDQVNPGMTDVWYDGVDADCGFNSDFDKDGDTDELEWQDGWPDAAWPAQIALWDPDSGGTRMEYVDAPTEAGDWDGADCDEEDPLTGGNLGELWDDYDRTCDGEIDNLDLYDAYMVWDAYGASGDNGIGSALSTVGDLDGDGYDEIVLGDLWRWESGGAAPGGVYIISATLEHPTYPRGDAMARIDPTTDAGAILAGWAVAGTGDLDKGGSPDVVVGAPLFEGVGGALVYAGEDLTGGAALTEHDAMAVIRGGALAGLGVESLHDINADKMPEVAVYTDWYGNPGAGAHLWIGVYSGVRLGRGGDFTGDDAMATISDSALSGGDVATGLLSGDDVPDLIASSASGTTYVFDGQALWDGEVSGVGDAETAVGGVAAYTLTTLGDVDEDGYAEAVLAGLTSGVVYVIDGDSLFAGATSASDAAMFSFTGASYDGLRVGPAADWDGDGLDDLVIGAPGAQDAYCAYFSEDNGGCPKTGRGQGYWLAGDTVASGGTLTDEDADASFGGTYGVELAGYSWVAVDTQRGTDLAIGSPQDRLGSVHFFDNLYPE